jgi:hypothetical protein
VVSPNSNHPFNAHQLPMASEDQIRVHSFSLHPANRESQTCCRVELRETGRRKPKSWLTRARAGKWRAWSRHPSRPRIRQLGWRRSVMLLETRLALWWIRPRHKTVDDHGQYDQRQAPCPVVSPVPGSQKAGVESGLNNSHRHPVLWPTRFAYDVPIRSMPSRWDVPSIPTQTHKAINNVRSVEPWELAKVTESRAKKEEVLALEI